jgi:2-polyprenyl-3-methyl-5-hydroxy-6-metoxy-1,4-benzoquinol methylase
MDDYLDQQKQRYDRTWTRSLQAGKMDRGNTAADLTFVYRAGLFKAGLKVLEFGCGSGTVAAKVAEMGCEVTATDISETAIEYARANHSGVDFRVCPAESTDFADECFDIVMSFDVFEHLPDVDKHISEVRRVLKAGGHYVLQTPNKYCNSIFETLKSRSLKWRRAHPSLHSPAGLKRRFGRHGFEVSLTKVNTINEFVLKKIGFFRGPAKLINTEKLPMFMQTNLFAVARKM